MMYIFNTSDKFVIEADNEKQAKTHWEHIIKILRRFDIYNAESDIDNIEEISDKEYELRCIMGEL